MRKLKSIAVCALCLCLLLGLAGCAAAQRPLHVTLVLKTETDVAEFWGMLLSGVRKAAEEYGVDLTVRTSPTETAIDEQIELIRQTAAEKPDVMILSAADYDRCAEATEEAIAAGIGVVAVDTDVNAEGRACFVGSNNYQIGQEMGSQMASYLPEGGKVAVIQHMLTTTTGIDRTRGVIDALTQAGNIEILGSYCCDNSTLRAKEITTALLEEEPDIRGFVCTNEVCNVGAANALVELGMGGKVFVGKHDFYGICGNRERIGRYFSGIDDGSAVCSETSDLLGGGKPEAPPVEKNGIYGELAVHKKLAAVNLHGADIHVGLARHAAYAVRCGVGRTVYRHGLPSRAAHREIDRRLCGSVVREHALEIPALKRAGRIVLEDEIRNHPLVRSHENRAPARRHSPEVGDEIRAGARLGIAHVKHVVALVGQGTGKSGKIERERAAHVERHTARRRHGTPAV